METAYATNPTDSDLIALIPAQQKGDAFHSIFVFSSKDKIEWPENASAGFVSEPSSLIAVVTVGRNGVASVERIEGGKRVKLK